MDRSIRKTTLAGSVALAASLAVLTGCTTDADKQSENLSVAAENFEVQRTIIVQSDITGEIMFEVTGRCSIERDDQKLQTICKHGPDDIRRHDLGIGDNSTYISTQLEGIDVSEYHTRIIIKPQNILPNFDLLTGEE